VHRYGDAKIDEPLVRAYERLFKNTLENEQPDCDINLRLAAAIKGVPDWVDVPDAPDSFFGLAPENAEDMHAWPNLPKGVLKRYSDADSRAFFRSDAEMAAYTAIMNKPKNDRTHREIRFIRYLCYRNGIDPREVM
jgi:hypothetical protein